MNSPYLISLMIGEGRLINALFYADAGDLTDKTTWIGSEIAELVGDKALPVILSTPLNDDGVAQLHAIFTAEGKAELVDSLAENPHRYVIFYSPPDATRQILDLH